MLGTLEKNDRSLLILADTIQRLKKIRLEKGISHEVLAKLAGISRPAISHIEKGKRKPTLMMALKMAHGLGTPLSSVLKEAEDACR